MPKAKSRPEFIGNHLDDDDEPCDCEERECLYREVKGETEIGCPNCGQFENSDLVCGDHGNKCSNCHTRFTVP